MRYMLLVYTDESRPHSAEEGAQIAAGHAAVMAEAACKGVLEKAEPLQPTSTATTYRVQNGKPVITDGPFAETKEQLAGYYILECKDLDEALDWAAKIPTACGGGSGCIEIRPIQGVGPGSS